MTRPKLLVLVSPEGDAMARDVAELCAALHADYELLVLAAPDRRALFAASGAFRAWRPGGIFGMGASIVRLRRAATRFEPDVVHAHGFPAISVALGTFPLALARRTIATFHDPQRERELPRKLVDRRFPQYLARAAAVVATYAPLARALEERFALADDSIAVVPHGVAVPLDTTPGVRPAGRAGPIVGWLGNLSADRAWETAIDAFALVRAALPDARLAIGGGGRARQFVAAEVRQRKIADAVTFRGEIAAREFFAAIDLLVVPVSRDAQPQSPLEALVAGVPVVAANAGALADAVGAMETGWLVPDTPDGFRDGTLAAWAEIDAAWAGAAAQRPLAIDRYGRAATVARYARLYARAIESASLTASGGS